MPRDYTRAPLADRFWPKVDKRGPDECWLWLASRQANGYGTIASGGHDGGHLYAHRVAYELVIGPIPDGLVIDHLCRNRACVNPAHLEAVRQRINALRGVAPRVVLHNAGVGRCDHPLVFRHEGTRGVVGRCPICRRNASLARAAQQRRERPPLPPRRGRKGVQHSQAKLTDDDVRAIRRLHATGTPQKDIAATYGIGDSHVSQIVRWRLWRHVE